MLLRKPTWYQTQAFRTCRTQKSASRRIFGFETDACICSKTCQTLAISIGGHHMKKHIALGVGLLMLIAPVLASAQTTNISSAIASLQALVVQLEQELQQLLAVKSSVTSAPQTTTASVSSPQPAASGMTTDVALVCNASAGLKRGDTDATTGGKVSQLQKMLGIDPATGYYGAQTQTGYNNICGVGGNSQPTSVAGMSEYTDSNFGFSFWYPTGWSVSSQTPSQNQFGGVSIKTIIISPSGNPDTETTLTEVQTSKTITVSGDLISTSYYFDGNAGSWMTYSSQYPTPAIANTSVNTMGGLHVFSTGDVFETDVIPLSATNFIVVGNSEASAADVSDPLTKTIVATSPVVATPVSTAQQTATIQAEANAYDVNTANTSSASGLSASPTSGLVPLKVSFTVPQSASSGQVDFGDGNSSSVLSIAEGSPQTELYFNHTYASPGTYIATLNEPCTTPSLQCSSPNTVTITVTGSSASSLQTYTNSQYGFSVQYPSSIAINTTPTQEQSFITNLDAGTQVAEFGPIQGSFTATESGWGTNGVVTTDGRLIVGVSTNAADVAHCMIAPQGTEEGATDVATVNIQGTNFLSYEIDQPAAGSLGISYTDTTLHNGICYSITSIITGAESSHMNAADGAANTAVIQQLTAELNSIAQSFRFSQ
jgi:hypothetical protein